MNCEKTRKILNSVWDGDEDASAAGAREHLRDCEDCQQWHESTVRVLAAVRSYQQPPVPDIAAMVARRLPAQHPVATRNHRVQWRPFVGISASCVLVGGLTAMILAFLAGRLLNGGIAIIVNCGRAFAHAVAGLLVAGRSMAGIADHLVRGFTGIAVSFGPVLLCAAVLNLAVVIAVLLLWRRRSSVSSACLI